MSEKENGDQSPPPPADKPQCGVVMPISAIENCSEQHWADVRQILFKAIEDSGMVPNLVSDADDVGVIQKRIIQNLYENPLVVCDVSAKNPNVMFELGIRLAFDKPTVIVKDEQTPFSFDTAPIEHIPYPRDLRFPRVVAFQNLLTAKIAATFAKSQSDSEHTTFLKHFGTFTVAKLDSKEVPQSQFILQELKELRTLIATSQVDRSSKPPPAYPNPVSRDDKLAMLRSEMAVIILHEYRDLVRSGVTDVKETLWQHVSIRLNLSSTGIEFLTLRHAFDRVLMDLGIAIDSTATAP